MPNCKVSKEVTDINSYNQWVIAGGAVFAGSESGSLIRYPDNAGSMGFAGSIISMIALNSKNIIIATSKGEVIKIPTVFTEGVNILQGTGWDSSVNVIAPFADGSEKFLVGLNDGSVQKYDNGFTQLQ